MNNRFEEKLSAMKSEHLTDTERSAMRERVLAFTTRPIALPSAVRPTLARRTTAVLVGGFSVFALTASVSFAAEAALPGEPLYPIKVHVNEEVKRALARTPEAKARVAEAEVERRATEIEALNQEDDLPQGVVAELRDQTEKSLRSFGQATSTLVTTGKVKEAKDRERSLKETMNRHRAALTSIGIASEQEEKFNDHRGRTDRRGRAQDEERQIPTASSSDGVTQDTSSTTKEIDRGGISDDEHDEFRREDRQEDRGADRRGDDREFDD